MVGFEEGKVFKEGRKGTNAKEVDRVNQRTIDVVCVPGLLVRAVACRLVCCLLVVVVVVVTAVVRFGRHDTTQCWGSEAFQPFLVVAASLLCVFSLGLLGLHQVTRARVPAIESVVWLLFRVVTLPTGPGDHDVRVQQPAVGTHLGR